MGEKQQHFRPVPQQDLFLCGIIRKPDKVLLTIRNFLNFMLFCWF